MRALTLPLLSLLLAIPVAAQTAAQTPPPAPKGAEAENLMAPMPGGWKVAKNSVDKGVVLQQFVPDGQSADRWNNMITVLVFKGTTDRPLTVFVEALKKGYDAECAVPATVGPARDAPEAGYPTSLQLIGCSKLKAAPIAELVMLKTIKGKDSTYQVQRAWRVPASAKGDDFAIPKEAIADASAYLKTAILCDNRVPDRACTK